MIVNLNLFYSLILILLISYLLLGYYASRKVQTESDFFLANRSLGVLPTTFSLVATQLGGGAIIGVSEMSYKYGIIGVLYTLGLSLGMITISYFIAAQLRNKSLSTVAEIFERDYSSAFLRKFASLFSIISLLGIFIAIVVSSRKFLHAIEIDSPYVFYGFWICLLCYTVIGGVRAVAYTDVLQLAIILFCFVVTAFYVFYKSPDNLSYALDHLVMNDVLDTGCDLSIFSLILVPFLFIFIEQDIAQKFFSAKNARVAKVSAFAGGIILLLFSLIPAFFGIAANNLDVVDPDRSVIMQFIYASGSEFIFVMVAMAVLAAIMSTADSLLCAVTSNIMIDWKLVSKPSKQLIVARAITILLGLISIIVASFFDNILETMLASYELMLCILFVPYILCYVDSVKKIKLSAFLSIFSGFLAYLIYSYFQQDLCGWPRVIFCIAGALVAYFAGNLLKGNEGDSKAER